MPGVNDASHYKVGEGNCAYCAVGAVLDEPASQVMQNVYTRLGEPVPNGSDPDYDCGLGLALLHSGNEPVPKTETLPYQIHGIREYLVSKGCEVVMFRAKEQVCMSAADAIEIIQQAQERAKFLVLTGVNVMANKGIGRGAHWTVAQKQEGAPAFYDYQLNVANAEMREVLTRLYRGPDFDIAGVTARPPSAFGAALPDKGGLVMLLGVTNFKNDYFTRGGRHAEG